MANTNITKLEILKELQELKTFDYDFDLFVIIDDVAKILNDKEVDTVPKDKINLDIWVDPAYYDYLIEYEEMAQMPEEKETFREGHYIGFSYTYIDYRIGSIKLHKGIKPKPRSKKIHGYNVQINDSNIANFRVVK